MYIHLLKDIHYHYLTLEIITKLSVCRSVPIYIFFLYMLPSEWIFQAAGTVPTGPNINGRMDPGMNTNILTESMKSKYVRISIRNISFLYSL